MKMEIQTLKKMSAHDHTTDFSLLVTGLITGFFGLHLAEIDLIIGIVLKLVSIISFVIVAIVNLKKLFKKEKNGND